MNSYNNTTPAQNALNKTNPAFRGFLGTIAQKITGGKTPVMQQPAQPKVGGFQGKYGTNQNYAGPGGYNYAGPATQPKPAGMLSGGGLTGGGSTGTMPFQTQQQQPAQPATPPAPQQGTPQYYAGAQEKYAQNIAQLGHDYAPKIAAPYGQFGIGDAQKRLSDYELSRMNALVGTQEKAAGINAPLLSASLPQTIGPIEYAYSPLGGAQAANAGAGSNFQRVANAGALGQVQSLGGESVGLQAAQNTISNMKSLIGNDNTTAITKLNQIINNVRNGVSDPSIASFRSTLGALAQAVQSFNPSLADQLTSYGGGDLGNQDAAAIVQAINSAQQAIQSRQQAVQQGISGGQAQSGNTGGNVVQTAVGTINTNW